MGKSSEEYKEERKEKGEGKEKDEETKKIENLIEEIEIDTRRDYNREKKEFDLRRQRAIEMK